MTWIDDATGLDCMIVRNHWGAWCGYVGVPPGHPAHGKNYDEAPNVSVHGGLTFAGMCDETEDPAFGICHVPAPGRPGDVYWLGFDCGHAWDIQPEMAADYRERHADAIANGDLEGARLWSGDFGETYKTLDFVTAEVTQLAAQLVAA